MLEVLPQLSPLDSYSRYLWPMVYLIPHELQGHTVLSREGGVASWLRRGLTYSWLRVRATRGAFLCLQIYFCCLPCRVPCPDGIKLQSLGNVRFRNWRREVGKMAIATTSSSKLSDHRKGHVAIGNTHTHPIARHIKQPNMYGLIFKFLCANLNIKMELQAEGLCTFLFFFFWMHFG